MQKDGEKESGFPPPPATAVLGYRAQNLQSGRNLLSKDIIFFPKRCNANPMSILECDHGSRVTHSPHTKPDHTVQAAEGPDEPERSRSRGWMSCSLVLAGTQGNGEGPGLHFAPAAHLAGHPRAAAGPAPS